MWRTNASKEIIDRRNKEVNNSHNILILGISEGGKSTFFQQVRLHYNDILKWSNKGDIVYHFRRHFLWHVRLVQQAFNMPRSEEIKTELSEVQEWKSQDSELTPRLVELITLIWNNESARQIYLNNQDQHPRSECLEYFCSTETLDRLNNPNFQVKASDVLRSTTINSGVHTHRNRVQGQTIEFWDAPGSIGGRKSWSLFFEDSSAILYILAADDFNRVLYEDSISNRMEESFRLLQDLTKFQNLRSKPFIVLVNKVDLLGKKLREIENKGVNLNNYFPGLGLETNYDDAEHIILKHIETRLKASFEANQRYKIKFVSLVDYENFPSWFEECVRWLLN